MARPVLARSEHFTILRPLITCIVAHRKFKPMTQDIKKVVLAYSGGLDTSVILRWLQDTYNCEVVTFTADLGQGEELEPARQKAEMMGIKDIFIAVSYTHLRAHET